MQAGCAKTAERIDVLFELETPVDTKNTVHVLDGGPIPTSRGRGFDAGFAKLLWPLVTSAATIESTTKGDVDCMQTYMNLREQ